MNYIELNTRNDSKIAVIISSDYFSDFYRNCRVNRTHALASRQRARTACWTSTREFAVCSYNNYSSVCRFNSWIQGNFLSTRKLITVFTLQPLHHVKRHLKVSQEKHVKAWKKTWKPEKPLKFKN